MDKGLRVFIYVQHLSGVGHMMRSQQIGLALAERHRVSILDGGRRVTIPEVLQRIEVPRLARCKGQLGLLDGERITGDALDLRRQSLCRMLEQQRSDVVLVEHFPFSKWELAEEINVVQAAARRVNPGVKIIASLRDVCLRTRHEDSQGYENRVLRLLDEQFDALLVHADPQLCQLGDYFSASERIQIPVFYTGIVASRVKPLDPITRRQRIGDREYVVASVGGGADRTGLLRRTVRAWLELADTAMLDAYRLLLFSGLEDETSDLRELAASEQSIEYMGFDPYFTSWLSDASLSISCAGYNTCANLLATRTPALLMPDPAMSDQPERVRLLVNHGIADSILPEGGGDETLVSAISARLGGPKTSHTIKIDGAAESARCIERVVSGFTGD